MAAKKRTRSKQSADAPLIPTERKQEVLGLLLIALGLLVSLAILTYSPADQSVVERFSWQQAFNPGEVQAQNALGLVGAALAQLLVPNFLGYTSLVLTGLMLVWGYVTFRRRLPLYLPLQSALTVAGALIGAALIGWFGATLDADLTRWAGAVGMGVAGWMTGVLGTVGSLIVLIVSGLVTLLLAIDLDVQRTIDRFGAVLGSAIAACRAAWTSLVDRWRAYRTRRAEARRQRRAERETQQSTPEAQSTSSDAAPASAEASDPPAKSSPAESSPVEPSPPSSSSPDHAPPDEASSAQGDVARRHSAPAPADDTLSAAEYRRRNDLFRGASEGSPSLHPADSAPDDAPNDASGSRNQPPSSSPSGAEASALESAAPNKPPNDATAAPTDAPASSAEPDAHDPPAADDESHDDVELQVQEQIEEEKADALERVDTSPREAFDYTPPSIDLLDADANDPGIDFDELERNKQVLLDKLDTYNIDIQNIKAVVGPTVTRYELTPAPGIKVSSIKSREDDLAMAMAAQGIRMIAPIPGKSAVGVEIPNRQRELVRLRDVIGTAKFRDADMELPMPIGKTIEGEVFLADLTQMPHLLIAGATGSGKSVGLNALITALIYASHPADLKFVIVDPKKIELQQYEAIENHFLATPEDIDEPVITDIEKAQGVFKSCEKEMEERYDLLSEAGVRGIQAYNRKFERGELDPEAGHRHMPYVVVVVDELADLVMTADEIEEPIARLAQMARAVGIHLVLATQRPSVDVITGLIKANFPSRIAYQVASRVDSRTILDQIGAEGLVGNGDLLYMSGSRVKRLQGPFVSIDEVDRINEFIADQQGPGPYTLPSLEESGHGPDVTMGVEDTDDLFEKAARITVRHQQGSVSLLQRKLAVGYTRAARIVDQLEEAGIVGQHAGTQAREVFVESEEELEEQLHDEQ